MAENNPVQYDESSIRSLDWKEHIRLRPGMYIGKLGDGASVDDGIYVLVKEIVDNSIDEHMMGNGKDHRNQNFGTSGRGSGLRPGHSAGKGDRLRL